MKPIQKIVAVVDSCIHEEQLDLCREWVFKVPLNRIDLITARIAILNKKYELKKEMDNYDKEKSK